MNRLAIVTTHPIQYYAPLFQRIAAEDNVSLKVFYSRLFDETQFDPDFGLDVVWDIPLTQGYDHDSFQCSNKNGILNMIHSIREFDASALMVFGWNFPGHLSVIRHFSNQHTRLVQRRFHPPQPHAKVEGHVAKNLASSCLQLH